MELTLQTLRAAAVGVDRLGVCAAAPFTEVEETIRARVEEGSHAGLGFTFEDPARSCDIRQTFPWAERLVVAGRSYLPEAGVAPPGTGQALIARFAVGDFYAPLRQALENVARVLQEHGHRAEVVVDRPFLVDRAAAVRAGLGWWGKNTMVLAPSQGPWMLFGSVVTDAVLETTAPMQRDCGTCEACIPACPTGALVAPGVLDARLCLAAVLQRPGAIPVDLREAVGDRLYGCDDCLDACPPGDRLARTADERRGDVDLAWLLAATDRELAARFGHFYLARGRVAMLRRNALVVAANQDREDLIDHVAGFCGHPDPILAEHARWALGRLRPGWAEQLREYLSGR